MNTCPTPQQALIQARDQIVARIVELTATANPDTNLQGRDIRTGTYLNQLMDDLAKIEEAIQRAGGSFEIRAYGC